MTRLGNPLDVLKLLDGSNCRKCGKPTCMAFAVAICNGQKRLEECPTATIDDVSRGQAGATARQTPPGQDFELVLEQLTREVAAIDLAAAAKRLGASYANGKLTIKCLGRDFSVDDRGTISTDLHVHGWLAVPAKSYLISGGGGQTLRNAHKGEWNSRHGFGFTGKTIFAKRTHHFLRVDVNGADRSVALTAFDANKDAIYGPFEKRSTR